MLRKLLTLAAGAIAMIANFHPALASSPEHIAVSLRSESAIPAPGRTVMLALRMQPQAGWHGYWSNPGESGLPPSVQWSVPPGVTVGGLRHPAPETLRVAGMTSYVHGGEHILLAPMALPDGMQAGESLPVEGKVSFLACSESLCVPQKAIVRLDLTVGAGTPDPAERALFRRARSALPSARASKGTYDRRGALLALRVPATATLDSGRATFYPTPEGTFERTSANRLPDGSLLIEGRLRGGDVGTEGVVSDGAHAYRMHFAKAAATETSTATDVAPSDESGKAPSSETISATEAVSPLPPATPVVPDGNANPSLWLAVLGALAGGLLLNLMPCVFPILSLKAMHLARAGESGPAARRDALAYTAGTLITSVGLGVLILALRATGVAVGWSFQLQSAPFIFFLLVVVTAIALNLAGLFAVRGPSLERQGGRAGSFGTGVLATIVATPCSAPFMATAIGAAMLLPAVSAILVFAGLGLGLSAPFLAIATIPALRRRLPRPGAWMVRLQRMLSVPMFATAVGLAWLLGRQAGADAMALGVAVTVVVGLALWHLGTRQRGSGRRPWLVVIPAALAVILGAWFLPSPSTSKALPSRPAHRELPFSTDRLAELRAAGTPVFLDFTADWCLNCKVNEKVAIDRVETRKAFAKHGVVTLVGDWTNGDPAITAFLAAHKRNSIPFYVFYRAGEEGEALPQILTPDMLVSRAEASRTTLPSADNEPTLPAVYGA